MDVREVSNQLSIKWIIVKIEYHKMSCIVTKSTMANQTVVEEERNKKWKEKKILEWSQFKISSSRVSY